MSGKVSRHAADKASRSQEPNNKESHDNLREHKKLSQRAAANHEDKVSRRKKNAGLAAIFFMCGIGLLNFLSTVLGFIAGNGVIFLDVQDTAQLKNVLFGGDPWLVYCVTKETESHRLPLVLEDSSRSLGSSLGVKVGVLRCWDATSTGRSVASRFKLRDSPPLAFVVANGNKPRSLNMVGVSKAEELEKKIKPALKIETYPITALKQWPNLCTSRRACIVVGHKQRAQRDTAMNVLRPLLDSFRTLKLVTLDTAFWQLKLEDNLLATRTQKGGADVLCLSRDDVAGGNATYSGSFLQNLDSSSGEAFFKDCMEQKNLVHLKGPPRINARPSKPRVVSPEPMQEKAAPAPTPAKPRSNVDHVGSRAQMEKEDEALFEAVDEAEQASIPDQEEEEESDEDVEL